MMRTHTIAGLWFALALTGCSSSSGPNPTPPPPPPPPPGSTTARLTIEIPPLPGNVLNGNVHKVIVIPGSAAPTNRAGVTVETYQCASELGTNQPASCDYDIPIGTPVAIVAEENLSFSGAATSFQPVPPDVYPTEFVEWTGNYPTGAVSEPGFLRFTMDQDRTIQARFTAIQPMVVHVNGTAGESVLFKVHLTTTPMLTLPPQQIDDSYDLSVSDGTSRAWFFLRDGSSATIDVEDDISHGCSPGPGVFCSHFKNWSGGCSGTGACTLVPDGTFQAATANIEQLGG